MGRVDEIFVSLVDRQVVPFSTFVASRQDSDRRDILRARVCGDVRALGDRDAAGFWHAVDHRFWRVPMIYVVHAGPVMFSELFGGAVNEKLALNI